MIEKCNNTSVGIIVWQEGKILLIERKKFPFGFAPPAGHVDADDASFEQAAKRELQEEVGLVGESLVLIAKKHPEKEKGEEGIVKDGDAVTPQEVESMLLDLASDLSEPYSLIRENEKYRVNRQRRMFDFRLDYIARFQTEQANAHYLHDS
jgi:8-oxo-dGTP pyrophosphatase MutT (NUDIX family)